MRDSARFHFGFTVPFVPHMGAAGVVAAVRFRNTLRDTKDAVYVFLAVGIGLAWGRGGMLVMGQGVFFGLGGYTMAMHMKLEAAGPVPAHHAARRCMMVLVGMSDT